MTFSMLEYSSKYTPISKLSLVSGKSTTPYAHFSILKLQSLEQ